MEIERTPEWRLTRAQDAEIAALMIAAFGEEFGGRSFHKQRHDLRLTIRDGGALVGHLALHWRAVRLGERLVDVAGVGEVATAASHRGQGIAGALLDAAIAEAKGSVAAFVLLFGVAGLYGGRGFLPAANPLRQVNLDDARTQGVVDQPARNLLVLPLGALAWDDAARLDLVGPAF